MDNDTFTYLKIIKFSNIKLWDFKRYISKTVNSKYRIVSLSEYIKEENTKVKPFAEPNKNFEILGVNNKIGLFDAYIAKGSDINQAYKIVNDSFIAYNPYRVNVGSVGLKTSVQKNKYISPAYVVFSCKEGLLPEFLYLLFKTNKFNESIRNSTTGTVRQTLSFSTLKQIKIPLPNIEKQKELIKNYYKKIEQAKLCENKCQAIENDATKYLLNELGLKINNSLEKKSQYIEHIRFKDIGRWDYEFNKLLSQKVIDFGEKYNIVKFESIVNMFQYGTSNKSSINVAGIPVIRMNNISNGKLDIEDLKYIDTLNTNDLEKLKLNKGDLLFNRTNSKELVGKTCVFDKENDYIFASYLIRIKIDKTRANPFYINYVFNSPIIRTQINAVSRQVTGQANVNSDELGNFKLPLPSMNIQNKIVEKLNTMYAEENNLKEMENSELKKASLEFEKELYY